MKKSAITGKFGLFLTSQQLDEFIKTGKTIHDEDNKRFFIETDTKGFPRVGKVEILAQEIDADLYDVDFRGRYDYMIAGIAPYKG